MSSFIVVYDACVLYPFHLPDLLVRLAMSGLFQAKWTDAILDECFASLRRNREDLDPARLERTRRLMCTAVRDCLVTGYEPLVDGSFLTPMTDTCWPLPSNAQVIVTWNLSDFPASVLEEFDIEVPSPDRFLRHLIDLARARVAQVLTEQASSLDAPPLSLEDLVAATASRRTCDRDGGTRGVPGIDNRETQTIS